MVKKYLSLQEMVHIIEENGVNRIIHSIIGSEIRFLPNMKKDNPIKPEEIHGQDISLHMDAEDIPF